jgi:hypothetical protein
MFVPCTSDTILLGINEAQCIAADPNLTLLDVKRTTAAAAAVVKKAGKAAKPAASKKKGKK